jgi:hypothetical protein
MLGVVGEDVVDEDVVVVVEVDDGDGEEEGVNLGGVFGVEGEGRGVGLFAVVEVEEVD